MQRTWFDLPVESRLMDVWPVDRFKKYRLVPKPVKEDVQFPMPYWNLPVFPLDQKIPMLKAPKGAYNLTRAKVGDKLWSYENSQFTVDNFIEKDIFNKYEILHDQHLSKWFSKPKMIKILKDYGIVDSNLGVICSLKEYNDYRRYLAYLHTDMVNSQKSLKNNEQDQETVINKLLQNMEKYNEALRRDEQIELRHKEVFHELQEAEAKKRAACEKRLKRVDEVSKNAKVLAITKKIEAQQGAKEFTEHIRRNIEYANKQERQHKLDTLRLWKQRDTEKKILLEEMSKAKQKEQYDKRCKWWDDKIKFQEQRILKETQINILMDHEFTPEYKRYLKYIKRENYKDPPVWQRTTTYSSSSEESDEKEEQVAVDVPADSSASGERKSVFSRFTRHPSRRLSKKKRKQLKRTDTMLERELLKNEDKKRDTSSSKRKSSLKYNAKASRLIDRSILRLLTQSMQNLKRESVNQLMRSSIQPPRRSVWTRRTSTGKTDTRGRRMSRGKSRSNSDQYDQGVVGTMVEKKQSEWARGASETSYKDTGFVRESQIRIKPPNRDTPPLPIFSDIIYRYFDRLLAKVIFEYVTRLILPKFPEIINKCHWVSIAEGLPDEYEKKENIPCDPETTSLESKYSECIESIKDKCNEKIAPHVLILQESQDIRTFRHKLNGIGEITCSTTLIGNLIQSSPHPQRILDYLHWRADWILNYPPPTSIQEIYNLKYVIGIMTNIECPVFDPIYKLWEFTNDINMNPGVLARFMRYLEKKDKSKAWSSLTPVGIVNRNLHKMIDPLYMEVVPPPEPDFRCRREPFEPKVQLFTSTYLRRPIDPHVWEILENLIEHAKQSPEEFDLKCIFSEKETEERTKTEASLEKFKSGAPNYLLVEPIDYNKEVQKNKEQEESNLKTVSHRRVTIGSVEIIPNKDKPANAPQDKPVATGTEAIKENQMKTSQSKIGGASEISHNPPPSIFTPEQKKSSMSKGGRKNLNKTAHIIESEEVNNEKHSRDTESHKTSEKHKLQEQDKTGAKTDMKGNKESDLIDMINKKGDSYNNNSQSDFNSKKLNGNVKFTSKTLIGPHPLKTLDIIENLKRAKNRLPTPHPSFTDTSVYHDVSGMLEKAASQLGMPKKHGSFVKSTGSPLLKGGTCPTDETSSSTVFELVCDNEVSKHLFLNKKHQPLCQQQQLPTTTVDVNEVRVAEIPQVEPEDQEEVLRIITPDPESTPEDVKQELDVSDTGGELSSVSSKDQCDKDLEELRAFIRSKLPKNFLKVGEVEPPLEENIRPVPPIINKELLPRKRIIKRPLYGILKKIYGWVMTTVIRRRLLMSHNLPPKIENECFYKNKYDPSKLDLARGLAKLVLEENSVVYPFGVLEPYIEIVLNQTMDPSLRDNFTKRIIRLDYPTRDEDMEILKQFIKSSNESPFFKQIRLRQLKKISQCMSGDVMDVRHYVETTASPFFNPDEWTGLFNNKELSELSVVCQPSEGKEAAFAHPSISFKSMGSESRAEWEEGDEIEPDSEEEMNIIFPVTDGAPRQTKVFGRSPDTIKPEEDYIELRPGYQEEQMDPKERILDMIINRTIDVAPSLREITDELREEFSYHKKERKWLQKERQVNFIQNLTMYSPMTKYQPENRKNMKFVQSKKYPYFGTFKCYESHMERFKKKPIYKTLQKFESKTNKSLIGTINFL